MLIRCSGFIWLAGIARRPRGPQQQGKAASEVLTQLFGHEESKMHKPRTIAQQERFTAIKSDLLFGNTDARGYKRVAWFFVHWGTPEPAQSMALYGMAMSGSKRRHCSSHLCCSLFFPLNLGNAIRRTGDTGCNVLNVAAMLKEDFDLLAEALVGFVGRAGVRLVHVGVSVVSH